MAVTRRADPLALALERIWLDIPEGKWLAERELDELLLRLTGAYEGDFARASAIRSQLMTAQALEARTVDGTRECEYRRGEWTDWPDPAPGSEPFNEELRRRHEEDLRTVDRQRQRELEDSPWGWQRAEIVRLVEETVDRRLLEIEKDRARVYLAAVNEDAAA